MNTLIKLEEVGKFALAWVLCLHLNYAWWVFFAWLLVPDLSMIGYAVNTRVGAWLYNFFHHQGVGIVIGLAGLWLASRELQLAGLVLFGHSAMDRALGYGLKYPDDFKHTHLGWLGK